MTPQATGGRAAPAPPPRGAPSTRSAMVRQFLRLYLAVVLPVIVIVIAAGWSVGELLTMPNFRNEVRQYQAGRFDRVRSELATFPVDQWKPRLDATRYLYPTGLALEEASRFFRDVRPDDVERRRFERGDVAFALAPHVEDTPGTQKAAQMTFAFQQVPDTTLVLSTQLSFSDPSPILATFFDLLFAVLAAAPILWFWFRPFWRDLERLGRITEQIGSGNFSVQASPVRSAAIQPFAAAIDQMSLRIGELIDLQRRLTNSVAHELTTPIAQLTFALAMLNEPPGRANRSTLVEGMTEDLRELESLVAELLEYARLEHTAVFEPESVDLEELIARARHSIEHLPNGNKGVVLDMSGSAISAPVRCDAHQMQRAVFNLLRNALHYARSRVSLSAGTVDGAVWIHVDDDGPGIPETERARLFEPFARMDASRARDTGGHGLGLAIVQQVAKLHGGVSRIGASPLGGARVSIEW